MLYKELVEVYEKLEKISSKLAETEILANLFKKADDETLPKLVLLSQGKVFLPFEGKELGVAAKLMMRALAKASGTSLQTIEKYFKDMGDLGKVAEYVMSKKKQIVFLKKQLTVVYVYNRLREIGSYEGSGSQEKKLLAISGLLMHAEPKEAKYLVRTILGELRIGVAEGIIRDSLALAFLKKYPKEEAAKWVEYAWNILGDFGEVALIAKNKGIDGLKAVKPIIGRPIQPMLGIKANSIDEVLKRHKVVICEFKYDGLRLQVHKKGDNIWLFTRRLENVTKQFPDVVEVVRENLKADECIVEGEAWPIDLKTGKPMPFQKISQRIQRKYEIEKMAKEIPVQLNLFDIMYLNGETLFSKPLRERRKILESIVNPVEHKLQLAEHIETGDIKVLEKFYHKALELKQEGIMLKNPEAPYIFGRKVGGWYKIKPTMENLDLVIVGAEWGEGARSKWLSSFLLAVRDPDTGKFLTCGMSGTGLTEEQFEKMTEALKELIIEEKGKTVYVKPKIVVEVSYQEIQKSPKYESGYALRFPRIERIRIDKSPEEADTIDRLIELYKSQGKAG